MNKNATMDISIKLKRERQVDENDKFYFVEVIHKSMHIEKSVFGYIEKSFDESVFREKCPFKNIINVSIIASFDNEKDYKKYGNSHNLF